MTWGLGFGPTIPARTCLCYSLDIDSCLCRTLYATQCLLLLNSPVDSIASVLCIKLLARSVNRGCCRGSSSRPGADPPVAQQVLCAGDQREWLEWRAQVSL